jgi:hypothetical protein
MVSRRGSTPGGPQPIPATCSGVPAQSFSVLAFLVSTISRTGTNVSGSNDDFIALAGASGAVRFVVEGSISGPTLQLNIRAEPPEFGYNERWTATIRSGPRGGIVEGQSAGRFTLNECVAEWTAEPFVAEIVPFTVSPPPPPPPTTPGAGGVGVVINEFRPRGPRGPGDEFIELRNDSAAAVDIGGWRIDRWNSVGPSGLLILFPSNIVLAPGCHLLLAGVAMDGYSGATVRDRLFASGIDDDGGLALRRSDGTLADAVGMSAASAYKEGAPLANFGTGNADRSYERVGSDTNDNLRDFALRAPSSPINSTGSCSTR